VTKRCKPSMPSGLAARAAEAERRIEQRPLNPGVVIDDEPGPLLFASPHSNDAAWQRQITDAFGSNSISIAQTFLRQLGELCSPVFAGERLVPDEIELNGLLGFINSIRPENELQAALAAQMVAVHLATMRLAAQSVRGGHVDKLSANVMARLSSTFASQCEALDRLKGRRGRQEINVRYERHEHQHVHVDRGADEFDRQPHAPMELPGHAEGATLPVSRRPVGDEGGTALPCEDPGGRSLPSASGEGAQALPDARRRKRIGSADGP